MSKERKCGGDSLYTANGQKISQTDVDNFNAQYPKLDVASTQKYFMIVLILDKMKAYHVGASLKDAGKKCFGINLIKDLMQVL